MFRTINKKYNFYFALLFMALFLVGIGIPGKGEAATSTVRGAAWFGDTYKYVYFDCLDDVSGDRLDDPWNLCGNKNISSPICGVAPDNVFHFFISPCVNLIHHVSIDASNRFSGSAWNYKTDLISFDATSTTPDNYAFNGVLYGNCPTCTLANNCSACYNPATQRVYGYAKIIKDGTWIKLNGASTLPVSIQDWDLSNSVLAGHNIQAGDFVGTASYPASDLSFNCESEIGGNTSNCAARNYKVYISNLQVGNLSAPNWTTSQACTGQARSAVLRWFKKSGQQTAYEIVVNNHNSFSTSTSDYVCWSGKKYSNIANQYNLPNSDPTCASLDYNANYYWWLRLYDENDQATGWYQYNSNSASDTDGNVDGNAQTFTTFKHEFPSPYFTWSPSSILVSATTTFTNLSTYYAGVATTTWSTTDPGAIISATNSPSSTLIYFLQATGTKITLQIADSDSYKCSTSTTQIINYGLPIWREVKAE